MSPYAVNSVSPTVLSRSNSAREKLKHTRVLIGFVLSLRQLVRHDVSVGWAALPDRSKARQLFAQACTGTPGVAESCTYLGTGYLRGSGVMRDDVRAGQYLSQGCEGGVAVRCTVRASMYETGTSVTATIVTRAVEFHARGGTGGDQKACAWIAAHPQPAKK